MLENNGKQWTEDEVKLLLKRFKEEGWELGDLAKEHGRTPYAIIAKLQYYGLLVMVGYNYHRIEADPWELGVNVREMQSNMLKAAKEGA